MKFPTFNKELAQRVLEEIQEHPCNFDYYDWLNKHAPTKAYLEHTCGTSACIAGWCIVLTSPEDSGSVFASIGPRSFSEAGAMALLQIDDPYMLRNAHREAFATLEDFLFMPWKHEDKNGRRLHAGMTKDQQITEAVARLQWLIDDNDTDDYEIHI